MTNLNSLLASLLGGRPHNSRPYEEGRDLMAKVCEAIAKKYGLSMVCCVTREDAGSHQTFIRSNPKHVAMFVHTLLTDKEHKISGVITNRQWREILGKRFSPFQKSFYVIMGMGLWAVLSNMLPHFIWWLRTLYGV